MNEHLTYLLEGLWGWVNTWIQMNSGSEFHWESYDHLRFFHLIATDKLYNGIFQKNFDLFIWMSAVATAAAAAEKR